MKAAGCERYGPPEVVVIKQLPVGLKFGGHAEFMAVPQSGAIAAIPAGASDADAVSLLFGGVTALVFFDNAKLQAGEHVLVNGAS